MGIRLYPLTKDRAKLERLARVPVGTYDRLDALKAKHDLEAKDIGYIECALRSDALYEELYDGHHDDERKLNSFLVSGWGKFSDPDKIAPGYSGSLEDMAEVSWLLRWNGIPAWVDDLCEGVYWC